MKTIQSLKITATVILAAGMLLLVKSCKKSDNIISPALEKAAASKELYKNVSMAVVMPINKQADELFYRAPDGQMKSMYKNVTATGAKNNAVNQADPRCFNDCNTTNNASGLPVYFTLNAAERLYNCNPSNNYNSVLVRWTVEAPFVIKKTSLLSSSLTYAYVKFSKPGEYDQQFSASVNTAGQDFVITKLSGASTNCGGGLNVYEITCRVNYVPANVFESGWTVSSKLFLEVVCTTAGGYVNSSYVNGPTFSQDGYLPCNRIDKVIVNPSSSPNTPTSIVGLYTASCSPPSGTQPIDYHQVEYRPVTTTDGNYKWDAQSSPVYNAWPQPANTAPSPLLTASGGVSNLPQMVSGTGKWLIRYRNVKTGSCNQIDGNSPPPGSNSNTNGNWSITSPSLWVTEMWDMF
jgi:hypothetical protein